MKNNKQFYYFLAKAFGLFILWETLYNFWMVPHSNFNASLTSYIASVSSNLMKLWGYTAYNSDTYRDQIFEYSEIIVEQVPIVLIANSCNGLTLIALFAGFIIAYPGAWKIKSIYILIGSFLIFIINLIRIQILIFNSLWYPYSFEFNHKYTYTIIVYLFIFGLWMRWANYYSKKKNILSPKLYV